MYFFKCFLEIKEGFEFKKIFLELENCLLVLKILIKNDEFMFRSVIYDLMFMYRMIDDKYFENVLLLMEKLDEKKL